MNIAIVTNDPHLINFLDMLVDSELDFSGEEYDEWYCINLKPFKCGGCGNMICYAIAGPHHILIWENKDDDSILEVAGYLMDNGDYDPHIIRYNRIFGPCISYDKALELGWASGITHE